MVFLVLGAITARTSLTTHDTASHALGEIDGLLLRHVGWIVHQRGEFWNWGTLHLLNVTLELGRDWWFE